MKTVLFACAGEIADNTLRCGSWIEAIAGGLKDTFSIRFAVLTPDQTPPTHGSVCQSGASFDAYYGDASKAREVIRAAVKDAPDAVVLFGTESDASYALWKALEAEGLTDRTALFAQGIASSCARHLCEGIPARIVRQRTLRDLLRRDGLTDRVKDFRRRGEQENEMMRRARHFIGRTSFDRAALFAVNPDCAYYRCGDLMRPAFYARQWSYRDCEKHTVFTSQFYHPVKGFHYLLEAAGLLLKKYPDLKIVAAGYNPIRKDFQTRELRDSAYIRYLKTLAVQCGVADRITLTGPLSAEQMAEQYCRANVFVLPSSIENSPNSLGEAMLLGVPCVAADVGGVADLARHETEALLYPSTAPYMLAHDIDRVFSDSETAERLAKNGRARARTEYDREKNLDALRCAFSAIAEG